MFIIKLFLLLQFVPAHFVNAKYVLPPAQAERYYEEMVACTGITNKPFKEITWFAAEELLQVGSGGEEYQLLGFYGPVVKDSFMRLQVFGNEWKQKYLYNVIVLNEHSQIFNSRPVIQHEILHYLVEDTNHSSPFFGTCAVKEFKKWMNLEQYLY